MLIVAIPKSASTSLQKTLEKLHRIDSFQDNSIRINPVPQESNAIHKYHPDMRELTPKEVELFNRDDFFYKQHVFPSKNNMLLLRNIKKVILLRNTVEVIQAYRRGALAKSHVLLENFSKEFDEMTWINRAKELGLYQDLELFNKRWRSFSQDKNTLIVSYKELVASPNREINKIEDFFGIKRTAKKIELVKKRYSRGSPLYNEAKHLAYLALDKIHMYQFAKSIQKKVMGY